MVLTSGEFTLSAQEVEYSLKTKMAVASGGILFKTGEDSLTGESGTFNYLDKSGVINDASLFIEELNFYFKGGRIERFGVTVIIFAILNSPHVTAINLNGASRVLR